MFSFSRQVPLRTLHALMSLRLLVGALLRHCGGPPCGGTFRNCSLDLRCREPMATAVAAARPTRGASDAPVRCARATWLEPYQRRLALAGCASLFRSSGVRERHGALRTFGQCVIQERRSATRGRRSESSADGAGGGPNPLVDPSPWPSGAVERGWRRSPPGWSEAGRRPVLGLAAGDGGRDSRQARKLDSCRLRSWVGGLTTASPAGGMISILAGHVCMLACMHGFQPTARGPPPFGSSTQSSARSRVASLRPRARYRRVGCPGVAARGEIPRQRVAALRGKGVVRRSGHRLHGGHPLRALTGAAHAHGTSPVGCGGGLGGPCGFGLKTIRGSGTRQVGSAGTHPGGVYFIQTV